ncbi:MAG: FdhF/YdeP family oxidoreductase [Proteobacteria bacterium]|nr:FdhF/YdeP family oxidoreductase [Pseudomonadota bacterium]
MTDDAKLADVRLTELPKAAGGLAAIASTMRHLARDSGLVRGGKALLAINQPDGFDCPGCAWPEAAGLTHPLVRAPGDAHFRVSTWDAAIGVIADELHAAGPDQTALYTSGRTSNEAAFLYQLVGRMFGTNNFPDCSNMCHESSGVALGEQIGVGKGTVTLDDFAHADLILVIGQNPGTNHPRMLSTLRDAARRGATIVSINPLREVGLARFSHPQHPLDVLGHSTALATEFVQIPIGGDQAFFLGIGKAVVEAGAVDATFLADHVDGYDAYRAHVHATPWPLIVARAGVDEVTIRRIAQRYLTSRATIACWAMGLTQHKHAVATIQEVVNVMLLRGNIGRPGAGLCPVRGHSNVQGDRTMGIDHAPPLAFLDRLGETFGFAPPRAHGLDTAATIAAMERREVRAFVALGGNFLAASPDTERTRVALESCALVASIATKLNRTHLHPGARGVILPCLGRTERDVRSTGAQFVTVEDSMSMVHRSQGVLPPASPELRSEPAIIAGLARALADRLAPPDRGILPTPPIARVPWAELADDYDRIRDLIASVVPGFADFNTRVRTPDGFQLPNVGRDRSFATIGGRAKLAIGIPPDLTLPPGRLRMMTIRSHDQYNTTIYGLDDRYRGVLGERRVIFMNARDMVERHLVERQLVDLISEWTERAHGDAITTERIVRRFIVVPFELPRGNCATYFPEANPLVPLESVADRSNTPTSKSVVIRVVACSPVDA